MHTSYMIFVFKTKDLFNFALTASKLCTISCVSSELWCLDPGLEFAKETIEQ